MILCCAHVGRVIPALGFSPQISIPLFAPLVLFAFSLRLLWRRFYRGLVISLVAALVVVGNLGSVAYASLPFISAADIRSYYASVDEAAALDWLNGNVGQGKVVVALPPVSGRVCKYTSASSLVGHHSVTPEYNSLLANTIACWRPVNSPLPNIAAARPGSRLSLCRPAGATSAWLRSGDRARPFEGLRSGSVAIYKVEPLAE